MGFVWVPSAWNIEDKQIELFHTVSTLFHYKSITACKVFNTFGCKLGVLGKKSAR